MPDLSSVDGQTRVQEHITEDTSLIIVDNVSTLCSGRENEAEGWNSMQSWALRQRAAGKTVLIIHHAGKGGAQRGTSKREDILDTVIQLKHPANYEPSEGARFEVHFQKSRGIIGDAVKPFEATLVMKDNLLQWSIQSFESSRLEQVLELHRDGMNQGEIAQELGVNKSTVCRDLKKARQDGLINDE